MRGSIKVTRNGHLKTIQEAFGNVPPSVKRLYGGSIVYNDRWVQALDSVHHDDIFRYTIRVLTCLLKLLS